MTFDMVIEMVLMVTGVVWGGRGFYRMSRANRDTLRPGWSRSTGRIVEVEARRSRLRAEEEPLAARVVYSYITPAGPQEGRAELPMRRATPLSGSVDIAVHPNHDDRSVAVYPRPGRWRRFVHAVSDVGLGAVLAGYGGATLAGLLPFDAHDLTTGKIALALVAMLGAGYTWVTKPDKADEGTRWLLGSATVIDVAKVTEGWSSRWFVYVTYDGADGVRRSGTASRKKGERPEKGQPIAIEVDADDPGHFRLV